MLESARLPIINDNATAEEIKTMAEEFLELKSDIDLREMLISQPTPDYVSIAS